MSFETDSPLLAVNKIDTFYGGLQALWDVSFHVNYGEVVSLVGSNGAGKTTTLKTIAGLVRPASGSINFLDEQIDTMPPNRIVEKGAVLIPEGGAVFPEMSIKENLLMGAYNKKAWKNRDESFERVFETFTLLKERRNQVAGTLSGGQRQMLVIGRGLMSNPRLLMLDEPSLGLAPLLVQKTFEILKDLKDQKITILLVEQNINHALKLADRAYVLENGRIQLSGTSKELIDNPHVKKAYLGL